MKKLSIKEKAKRYDEAITDGTPVEDAIFHELKESEDEKVRKELIAFLKETIKNVGESPNIWTMRNAKKWLAWLEKQGEQKPIDKVEPKFNVYDWVVTDKGDTVQIGAVNNGYYTLCNGMDFNMSYVDKCWHKWTIQDAKDGDVLVAQKTDVTYESIFIFKKIENNRIIQYLHYYTTDADEEVCEARSIDGFLGFVGTTVHPATKEQREQLEKAMADAGYTFDFEKKELKKIEQNPAWSEEDEQYLLVCKNALYKYQSSNQWDASIIIRWLENKLKSFRPQNYWKPSDEQMKALTFACIKNVGIDKSSIKALYDLKEQLKQL